MIDPKLWRENIIKDVEELASPSYQTSVWEEGKGSDVSSYGEFMCRFFDDDKVELFIKEGPNLNVLNAAEQQSLERTVKSLKAFKKAARTLSDDEVLSHPQWIHLVELAQTTLINLNTTDHQDGHKG